MKPKNLTILENWILTPEDLALVMSKSRGNRLSFAWMILFYRMHGRFPYSSNEYHPKTIDMVAQQLNIISIPKGELFEKAIRTWERHRAEIRKITNSREATNADALMLTQWLQDNVAVVNHDPQHLTFMLEEQCRRLLIESPSVDRIDRIVRNVIFTHDENLYSKTYSRLGQTVRNKLDNLLQPDLENTDGRSDEKIPAILLRLRSDPGRVSLASAQDELNKLIMTRSVGLPLDLFVGVTEHELERYEQHVMVEHLTNCEGIPQKQN